MDFVGDAISRSELAEYDAIVPFGLTPWNEFNVEVLFQLQVGGMQLFGDEVDRISALAGDVERKLQFSFFLNVGICRQNGDGREERQSQEFASKHC